jgi:hypothetical protein
MMPDDDAVDVTAHDGIEPNAGMIADGYVTQHSGTTRDINAASKHWLFGEECVQAFACRVHGRSLAKFLEFAK